MSHAAGPGTTARSGHRRDRHRGGWALAALVVVGWLVVAGVTGPMTGRLSSQQRNDNATFLPASAESTKVLDLERTFSDYDTLPLILLFTSDQQLTQQDLDRITAFARSVPGLDVGEGHPVSDYLVPGDLVVVPSEDGQAALVTVPLDADRIGVALSDGTSPVLAVAEALRAAAPPAVSGLQVTVTGPGSILADFIEIFGDIDTTLLGATALVVAVILILVYRSPFLWVLPLLSAGTALGLASGIVYVLADHDVVTLNGQSQGILTVLVFGAGTDYALLLVSRYREELHHHPSRFTAMKRAWLGVVEPILASGATVIVGLMCLLFSELSSNKGSGPIAAIGIACALLVMLTFLPALLVVFPRGIFWPKVPQPDDVDEKLSGVWSKVAGQVGVHARRIWVLTTLALLVLAFFVTTLKADGMSQSDSFTSTPDSVTGLALLAEHFPAGSGAPAIVIGSAGQLQQMTTALDAVEGVGAVVPYTGVPGPEGATAPPKVVDGRVQLQVTLDDVPDSAAAEQAVRDMRAALAAQAPEAHALVGGYTAINLDTQDASRRDREVIIPIVLAVILVILCLLLRALLIPAILVVTVLLSFFATLGLSAIFFNHVFHFAGADSSFPLFAFVFLVALGIDYNIFLMTRVREESLRIGTRPGILKGLTVTGGVITSAGVVLAATFMVLGILPLVFVAELGFTVAVGVLLDTVIVRSLLVPALSYDIGRRIWWPSRLATGDAGQVIGPGPSLVSTAAPEESSTR